MKHTGWAILITMFWLGVWGIITVFFAELTGLIIFHASIIALIFTILAYIVSDTWQNADD